MQLQLSYFAWVRERMGCAGETISVPEEATTIADVVEWLRARDAAGASAFTDTHRIRAAMDGEICALSTPLDGARELALFPPVTGG